MTERTVEPARPLRHALANPLSALLGETQLLLSSGIPMDVGTRDSVREIEKQALRMRDILRESRQRDMQLLRHQPSEDTPS